MYQGFEAFLYKFIQKPKIYTKFIQSRCINGLKHFYTANYWESKMRSIFIQKMFVCGFIQIYTDIGRVR
jgi:hypothetical protein